LADAPWWKSAVIYQIYPRSFMDSNGDGVGDLAGITSKIDYLVDTLGIDAIWISPFFNSPMADFGYDVSDYTGVDPLFGDLDAFDSLVARCRERGLRLIIDWVPNHSSSEHPWFVESKSSRDNPKRDWYTWADPAPDGGPPNNWIAVFGGPAWEYDDSTGQYYLHSFLASQPDLNWRNQGLKSAMLDTLAFWLDRGVDGFRMDVVHFAMKDPELADNPVLDQPETGYKSLGNEYDRLVHANDRGHPDIHPMLREVRSILDRAEAESGSAKYSLGEIHLLDWNEWASYYGADNDELHMPYNFAFVNGPWTAQWARNNVEELEAALPEGAWPNYVLSNHDEHRLVARLGWDRSALAILMLLTLRGTPTIYYGDEVGMLQADIPPERQQDPWGQRVAELGRDGERTPMQWDATPEAGFTKPGVEPWLPIVDPDGLHNVAAQLDDPNSRLEFYRRLLAIRKTSSALQLGDYQTIHVVPDEVFAYRRSYGHEVVEIYLNMGQSPVDVVAEGSLLVSTDRARSGAVRNPTLAGLEAIAIIP